MRVELREKIKEKEEEGNKWSYKSEDKSQETRIIIYECIKYD